MTEQLYRQKITADRIWYEPVEPPAPQETRGDEPVVLIKPMELSDNRIDYFVSIRVGDREVTPHVFRDEYKAAYHVALYDWLLNGSGEEPDIVAFGPHDWPAHVLAPSQQSPRLEREGVARIIEPNTFTDLEREREWCAKYNKPQATWCEGHIRRCDAALAKADAILALLSPGTEPSP